MPGARLVWDEAKRQANLAKHGLDFADAAWVLDSDIRMDVPDDASGEFRVQSFAYVCARLKTLMVVHVERGSDTRIVSFRVASSEERKLYHEWLEAEDDPS